MADTTLRFEFVEGQAAGSSGRAATAERSAGSAAKSRDGLGDLFDRVSGGFLSKLGKFIERFRKDLSSLYDLFDKLGSFVSRMRSARSGGAAQSAAGSAARYVASEVVGGQANAATQPAAGYLEGRVLSTTIIRGGQALATAGQASAGAAGTAAASGAAAGGGSAAAAAGSLAGPVGIAIVAGLAATVYTTKLLVAANNKLRERFGEVAERIKDFSPALQAVAAINEAEILRYRVGLAARDGGSYAGFQRTQNQLDQSLTRLGDAISGLGLDTLGPIAEALAVEAKFAVDVLTGAIDAARTVTSSLKPINDNLVSALKFIRGQKNREDLKLPPEADILGLFAKKPDLSVEWNGRIYSGDSSRMIASGAPVFKDPLPTLGLP